MTDRSPPRSELTVLEGLVPELAIDLKGEGPYLATTVVDGDGEVPTNVPPSVNELTLTPEIDDEPGEHTVALVAEGPSDNSPHEIADLPPEELDDETGVRAEWTVRVVDVDELHHLTEDELGSLVESTVGAFAAGRLDLHSLRVLRAALQAAEDEEHGRNLAITALPEYEVLTSTIENAEEF